MLKNRLIHTSLLALSLSASPTMASDVQYQYTDGGKPAMTSAISQADYESLVDENKCLRLEVLDQKKARSAKLSENVTLMQQLQTSYGYVIQLDAANRALINQNAQITGDLKRALEEIAVLKQQLTSSLARCTILARENEGLRISGMMYWGVGGYYIRLVLLWMNKPVEEKAIASADQVEPAVKQEKKVRSRKDDQGENVAPNMQKKGSVHGAKGAKTIQRNVQEKDAVALFTEVVLPLITGTNLRN